MSRRAKIVCTLGPATSSPEQIARLVEAGLDVARLNLSHGHHADHEVACARVRAASDASGRSVGVLVDLQGPKIRLGTFPGGPVRLCAGDGFTITTEDVPGDRNQASTTYQGLAQDVRDGQPDPDRRRPCPARGDGGRRPPGAGPGCWPAGQFPTTRASTCRGSRSARRRSPKGRARPALGHQPGRGHGGAVLRPHARKTRAWPGTS